MKFEVVEDSDIGFARLSRGDVHHTERRPPEILVDVDAAGNALSIEVVDYSSTPREMIDAVLREFGIA